MVCSYENNYKAKGVSCIHTKPLQMVMGLVISVVCYLQADIPVIVHLSVNCRPIVAKHAHSIFVHYARIVYGGT